MLVPICYAVKSGRMYCFGSRIFTIATIAEASGRKFVLVPNCLATIVLASGGKFFWFLFF